MMAVTKSTINLNPVKAPALPLAPAAYTPLQQEQLLNALRLYFRSVDNWTQIVAGPLGGAYINNPHISASGNTDQYAGGDNTPTKVLWDTLEAGAGFTLNVDNTATPDKSGVYKIDYSLLFANTDNAAHDVEVWLKVDGTLVARSGSIFTLPARKSAGVPTYLIAYSSVTFEVEAGTAVSLWWVTDKAYSTTGPVDGVYMQNNAAKTSPYTAPAAPAAIGSITFVSSLTV